VWGGRGGVVLFCCWFNFIYEKIIILKTNTIKGWSEERRREVIRYIYGG
jgi:hypothetical protein